MSDRVRFFLSATRYRIRYDLRGFTYGFTHPGEVIRAHLRGYRAR